MNKKRIKNEKKKRKTHKNISNLRKHIELKNMLEKCPKHALNAISREHNDLWTS